MTRLSASVLVKLKGDLERKPWEFGYRQETWSAPTLCRHLAKEYQAPRSIRQCRRLLHQYGPAKTRPIAAANRISKTVSNVVGARRNRVKWRGISGEERRRIALSRIRQLGSANLPLATLASTMYDVLGQAIDFGDAAQAFLACDPRGGKWVFRNFDAAAWGPAIRMLPDFRFLFNPCRLSKQTCLFLASCWRRISTDRWGIASSFDR
jgi:hypothetical protein